ncbi:MAG: DNA polymerase I, partial [Lachnospiraceae bacterium]|nr:DNA polymerase I [Lachnospiraceae bacterium]
VMGCLSRMEDEGIRTDREALKAYSAELKEHVDQLEEEIFALAGERFNINSPKQLAVILFEKLGLPTYQKKKGTYSTAADILEKLAPDYPVVSKVLEYRTYSKLRSTYAEGLQNYIANDGRIHCNFNQTITATGRISSTNPNLQNIPARLELGRRIRKVFVPKDGCVFIDADYSQIELRILAHLSKDKELIEAYNSAEDIHALTASQVFGVPLADVTPEMRRSAKVVNFGIIYGMSAFSLADGLSITIQEAKQYMENYFASYPGIKAYLDAQVAFAKENGYVTTIMNRVRPIPELSSVNFNQRAFGERVAMNSPIQGSAADIMKLAMIRVEQALKDEGLRTKIVLQIHDELVLEAPADEQKKAAAILVREMQNVMALSVPLIAEAHAGYSLYDTK